MKPTHPEVVLLATEWQLRSLLRAQLIEDEFDVVAVDTWAAMRSCVGALTKPAVAVVDLQGLPAPDRVLDELATVMNPDRVLVLAAAGTVSPDRIEARGLRVVNRPVAIGSVVAAIVRAIGEQKHESYSA